MERIGDLLLDRAVPAARTRSAALLFIHGMWGGSWLFERPLALAAQAGWEAWAINLRGHHGSRPVADLGRVRLADYVQDVTDALQKVRPAIVIGYSMGGLLAQIVAARPAAGDRRAALAGHPAPGAVRGRPAPEPSLPARRRGHRRADAESAESRPSGGAARAARAHPGVGPRRPRARPGAARRRRRARPLPDARRGRVGRSDHAGRGAAQDRAEVWGGLPRSRRPRPHVDRRGRR
ncbi:MAG: hypothetical protein DME09_14685 [Candidatus Rokuibacteriota bacterium]|nr:MAG: hypothetical protein DME09_14685 [Candidatus Rokubacteria bacterium]